jgi:short-subunit dehydrogenase
MKQSSYGFAIIIGASAGIGAELVKQLAASGTRVAAVARRADKLAELAAGREDKILTYVHDVTSTAEAPELFQRITGDLGGLDLFIYCAGVMPDVGIREYAFEKDNQMLDVNVVGAVAWIDQAALRFDNVGHGTLVGIGSVAGDRGRCGQPVYNASKAFLATYMEALRNRLSKRGVKVVTIKPGPVATDLIAHLHFHNAMSPSDAARITLEKSRKTGEHYLKFTHRIAFWIIRNIPSPIFRRLKI